MDTITADPTVTRCLDAEWALNKALNQLNARRHAELGTGDFAAYAEAVHVHAALGKLVVSEGLQSQYRQARIDRINAFTRVLA